MTGQGLCYVRMKPGSEYVTDDDDHDDHHNISLSNVSHTLKESNSLGVLI